MLIFIKLPNEIKNKKACINFVNKDSYSFIYYTNCELNVLNKKKNDIILRE